MDWKTTIGVALIVLAFFSPVIAIVIFEESSTDYESCIQKCPSDFNGNFKDLECPKMCKELGLTICYLIENGVLHTIWIDDFGYSCEHYGLISELSLSINKTLLQEVQER